MPTLRFSCPKCTQVIECPDTNAGKKVACPVCKAQLRVPALPSGNKATPKSPPPQPSPARKKEEVLDELEEVVEAPAPRPSQRQDEEILDVEPAEPEEEGRSSKGGKARARLGKKLRTHTGTTGGNIVLLVFCALLAAAGVVFIPLGFLKDGGFLCGSVLMIPLGIIGCVLAYFQLGNKVVVYEGGLIEVRRRGERVIPWEDIESAWQQITENYYNGVYTGTTYVYTIRLYDGTKRKFSDALVKDVKKLGESILHETSQILYPVAVARYNKGKTVEFGKLGVSEDGLSYGTSLLSWEEIEAVRIKQGYISVRKHGKWLNWCNVPFASIPNPFVFTSLINQIVGIDDS